MACREKSATLWQAQQDEIAAVLAGVPAPPNGGQTQLSFTLMPRGAVMLASLTTAQQDAAARDMMLVIVDELRPWSLFEDQTTAVKADADPRMSLRRFLLKYRPDSNIISRRTLAALRSAEYTAQKALVIACLKTLPVLYGTTDAWTSDANVATAPLRWLVCTRIFGSLSICVSAPALSRATRMTWSGHSTKRC